MKKNFLLTVVLAATVYGTTFAQVSTTPEVPKNYKPAPKELLPMPGELTDEMIFPVLGKYAYTNEEGASSEVLVYRDDANKGTVWVNGMPQGKFKADLRVSPATYKIPAQKTLQNDLPEYEAAADSVTAATAETTDKAASRFSGKSLDEGTLLLDTVSRKLYIHVGTKYNEENPTEVFPEIAAADSLTVTPEVADETAVKSKKAAKKANKGTTYVLDKVVEEVLVTPAAEATEAADAAPVAEPANN
ncbi:hypothetical protein GCM10027051_07220 [Niabella terrae]